MGVGVEVVVRKPPKRAGPREGSRGLWAREWAKEGQGSGLTEAVAPGATDVVAAVVALEHVAPGAAMDAVVAVAAVDGVVASAALGGVGTRVAEVRAVPPRPRMGARPAG